MASFKYFPILYCHSSLNPSSCCIVSKTIMLIILLFFLYIIIYYISLIMSAPTYNVYYYYYTFITMYQIYTCINRYYYRLRIMSNRHVEVILTALYFNVVISYIILSSRVPRIITLLHDGTS